MKKSMIMALVATTLFAACGFEDAASSDANKVNLTLSSTSDFCYQLKFVVTENGPAKPADIANCAEADGDLFVADLTEVLVGDWDLKANAKAEGFKVYEKRVNVAAGVDNAESIDFESIGGDVNIDTERPLNLSGLTASATGARGNLHTQRLASDEDLGDFRNSVIDRYELASSKGALNSLQNLAIAAANALEAEILEANRRNADDESENDVPTSDGSAYALAVAELSAIRAEIQAAEILLAQIEAALAESAGSDPADPFPGHMELCLVDYASGNDVTATCSEVAVGISAPQSGTGCFEFEGLPLNRALRFRCEAAGYQVVLESVAALDEQSVALPSQKLNLFFHPDVAVGELWVGPGKLTVHPDGETVDISNVTVLQKQADGSFAPVAASCSHEAMIDVMSVDASCHTVTPGANTGCEPLTFMFDGHEAVMEVHGIDPENPPADPYTCQ